MISPALLAKDIYHHNNGLKHINITNSEGFSALFVVNTPIEDNSGVAHGVEHMVFRGSTAFPQAETLFQLTSLTDAKINASTFANTTYFHCQSQCPHTFMLAINYLLNGLFNPVFTAKDLHYEIYDGKDKGVIYRELLGAEQTNKKNACEVDVENKAQEDFCYGGVSSSIGKLSLRDLTTFQQRFYHAANITLVTANADVEKISQLISLLPKQYNQAKIFVDKSDKESSNTEMHKQPQKKYSQAINTLISVYYAWLANTLHQKHTYCQVNNNEAIENDAASLLRLDSQLITHLVSLSHLLIKNIATEQLANIDNKSTVIKKVPNRTVLPNLFTELLQQAKEKLLTNKQTPHNLDFDKRQAHVCSQGNALWLTPINTADQALATITSYIISAYPEFLMPRCHGYCYATQALAIENSTYLAIYSAFDISPRARFKALAQCLLNLSHNNHFISTSLTLAKIKYYQALQVKNSQVIEITPLDISAYLQALANNSHPKV